MTEQQKCRQCGTEIDAQNAKTARITQRRFDHTIGKQRVVTEELGPFCKDKPCAAHYQMGCEG